jgi:hypothetical protein
VYLAGNMSVDQSTIRRAVFDYLDSVPNLAEVRLKDVRAHVASALGLPAGYFSEQNNKEILVNEISAYRAKISTKGVESRKKTEDDRECRSGKFSNDESSTIMKVAKRYARDLGVDVSDLCFGNSEKDEGKFRLAGFWAELKELLPQRSGKVRT